MRRVLSVAAVVTVLVSLSAPDSQAAATQDDSCIVTLETGDVRCYANVAEMVNAESGGRYKLPASGVFSPPEVAKFSAALGAARSASASRSGDVAPAAFGVNASFWDGQGYDGGALVLEAGSGCYGTAWVWDSLNPTWQNRVESGKGYRNCEWKVWADPNRQGISFGYFLTATNLFNLNNNVESVRLQPN